jgi:hypothetical protein
LTRRRISRPGQRSPGAAGSKEHALQRATAPPSFELLPVRPGGTHLYRHALPSFLGFILGEFTMGGVYRFIGILFPDTAGYQTYP